MECRPRVGRVLGRECGGAVQAGAHGERETGGVPLDDLAAFLGVHDDPLEALRCPMGEADNLLGGVGLCLRANMSSTSTALPVAKVP
jgi:hypothetical protein